jgi:hypothetical protein
MIISFSKKFVFVKTNKTAGSSFQALLTHHLESVDWMTAVQAGEDALIQTILKEKSIHYLNGPRASLPKDINKRFTQHSSLEMARSAFPESQEFFSFGVLRNPFARLQSSFRWKRGRKIDQLLSSGEPRKSIETKLQRVFARFIERDQGLLNQRGRDLLQGVTRDGSTWSVDSIFKMEELGHLRNHFLSKTGVSLDLDLLPHFKSNTTKIPSDIAIWTDRTIDAALRTFRWEFEHLSYNRSPF